MVMKYILCLLLTGCSTTNYINNYVNEPLNYINKVQTIASNDITKGVVSGSNIINTKTRVQDLPKSLNIIWLK